MCSPKQTALIQRGVHGSGTLKVLSGCVCIITWVRQKAKHVLGNYPDISTVFIAGLN